MSAITSEEVVLAAVGSAGPRATDEGDRDYSTRVRDQATLIYTMLAEASPIRRHLDTLTRCKVFPATVTKVVREKSSTRGKVTLATRPSKWNEDGVEEARTERTDNPDGLAMAKKVSELKGHRVLLYVEVEEFDGGKARVIRHVEDLGIDKGARDGSKAA